MLQDIGQDGWQPPSSPCIKLTVDAAIREDYSTIAIIARDSNGSVLSIITQKFSEINPLVAEIKAILVALNHAIINNWTSIVVESDCMNAIKSFKGNDDDCHWEIKDMTSQEKLLLSHFEFF
ncbi:Ribonuclease H-like domain containing protein [Trema orientale]|uniref:Ribonuclease H-like domain containing protein n=1 Tax=Trema orientale TaxID=63057 RepID=A0A2P5FGJ1_TREOI|nr:Ribonuclease H-like domain containing protein [Trema orientale]